MLEFLQEHQKSLDPQRIANLADTVCKKGLAIPAIFLLEMHKPFRNLAHIVAGSSSPLLIPLFGMRNFQLAMQIISNREHLERLISEIELRSRDGN